MNLSKTNIKKRVSWIIIFSLILSFILPITTFAQAENNKNNYSVKVRVEGYDSTFVKPITVAINDLDLSDYPSIEKSASDYDSLKPIHAIVHALEKSGIDPKDPSKFDIGYGGNYIKSINGLGEFDKGQMSGWMYWVDNQYANLGVGEYEIKSGQEVVIFYVENYTENVYSWFDKQSLSVDQYENFELKLNGNPDSWGGGTASGVEGATILINDKEHTQNGKAVKTDSNGKISLNIEEPGTYHVSATKKNDVGQNILTRPYASVTVNKLNTIKSIEPVKNIEVDYATKEIDVISKLPKTTNIIDSLDKKHSVDLNWSIDNYSAKKSGEYTAISNFKLPAGIHQTDPETDLELSMKILVKEQPSTKPTNLEDAINKAVNYYKNNNPGDPNGDWEAYVGLWGVGDVIDKDYNWESIDPGFGANISGNETLRYAYSLLGQGQDPSNIWGGRNLFKELSSQQKDDGSFTTLGKQLFAILLLDAGEEMGADLGDWNKENKQKAIDNLLSQQNENGSFGLFSHLDYTGWSLIALSEYREQKEVNEAINKSLEFLKSKQTDNGAFIDNSGWGSGENSNSIACVVQGLVAVGEDVLDPNSPWVKNGNTVADALIKFQQDNGSFWWEEDNKGSVAMATKQSLVALSDLKNQKSTWHRLGEEVYLDSFVEKDIENLISNINKLPKENKITYNDKLEIMKAYNMFLSLPKKWQLKVDNSDLLLKSKEKVMQIEKEIEYINDNIWSLPGKTEDIDLSHKEKILDLMERYNALSDSDKKYIEYYSELEAAKAKIELIEKEESTQEDPKEENSQNDSQDNQVNDKDDDVVIDNNGQSGTNTPGNNENGNTAAENSDNSSTSSSPKTGDNHLLIPIILFLISLSTIVFILRRKKLN
ncbi:MAG: DUF4430 domain-containing protein [Senegalia sp. (in: firmicutes)]|uniref:DUF4430 domain-containing protein n=1 Tax=Senegalia sp. (in: firmicutes) TaxID=1924098 RepID=UPI003F9D8816